MKKDTNEQKEIKKEKNRKEGSLNKITKISTIVVIALAVIAGGTYICRSLFFSTPETTIRNFYASISNNQLERCITYTDIQDRLDAQVPNQEDREKIMQTFLKQFNIQERTIHINILNLTKVSGDNQTAVYDIKYKTDITYKNGSDYSDVQSDKIYLTKIKGKWKIVEGSGMYSALAQIMSGVIEGQNSVLGGIK
ncbi:hypothetical protein [Clostridium thermobutyricum]|uniref:Lumazine-binding domain protein n=1 Tax=Clostridium thermobutyricum DSM 4928 TaxID=1121339 RepID=A0A1V4SWU9_9CLOT|nr:hypothetical protein [Clostridium thermobutyricum]OPX48784.1 lumazine-binding domain protein [Clostridium thermobutyricum DSM 4928]